MTGAAFNRGCCVQSRVLRSIAGAALNDGLRSGTFRFLRKLGRKQLAEAADAAALGRRALGRLGIASGGLRLGLGLDVGQVVLAAVVVLVEIGQRQADLARRRVEVD